MIRPMVDEKHLEKLQRVPSDHRRYLGYIAEIKEDYESVMNFVIKKRLEWTNLKPSGAKPFTNQGQEARSPCDLCIDGNM